jgi:YVTN family beta-propeller protein
MNVRRATIGSLASLASLAPLAPLAPLALVASLACCGAAHAADAAAPFRSPISLAVSHDGKTVFASDQTAGAVVAIDAVSGKPIAEIPVAGEPNGLTLSDDGKLLFVAQRLAHAVAVIDVASGKRVRSIPVGLWPTAVAAKNGRLYTCNRGDHSVSVVDVASGRELGRVPAIREPSCAAVSPDGARVVVTNLLPNGAGTDADLAAEVCILDAAAMKESGRIKLPPGSTVVTGATISPDGRLAYVVHALGRFNLPITQLERGWVHTYALSILDLSSVKLAATVLLDDLTGGAADPWAVVASADGNRLWIAHAGVHEVSTVEIGKVLGLLSGKVPEELARLKDGTRDNIWVRIAKDRGVIPQLANDLTALYIAGAIRRSPSGGGGPRGLALAPDGKTVYAANYFAGTIGAIDVESGKLARTLAVGNQPPADAARRGEAYFHDALRCFQRWHSCASCHPNGRVDGLPWDFMRDGIGNGKDVISLVDMMKTSPHNRRATRVNPHECVQTGVTGSHLIVPEEADIADVLAYIAALRAEPAPAAPPADAVARGKALFEGKASCAGCHPAPYYTDQKQHNVGVLTLPLEPDGKYDTPSLVEVYRTAPYFHDGRAATLKDVFTRHDSQGRHGHSSKLTPQELDDMIAFLLSL